MEKQTEDRRGLKLAHHSRTSKKAECQLDLERKGILCYRQSHGL